MKKITILILCSLYYSLSFGQQTVSYTQQTDQYDQSLTTSGSGGFYNNGLTELGMWMNGDNASTFAGNVLWKNFRTGSATSNSTRSLQVGDEFTITVATKGFYYGTIGVSLNSGALPTATWTNRTANSRIKVQQDGSNFGISSPGSWYYSNGSATSFNTTPAGTYVDYIIKVKLTAPNKCNITFNGTTYNDVDLGGTAGSTITNYSIYMSDDRAGVWTSPNRGDSYWKQSTQLQNTGTLSIGVSNSSFTISDPITNGLDANSTSTNSLSNSLTKSGTGSLTLAGANTYTGLTTVSGGTLVLNKAGGTTIPATNNVTVSSGTLQISTNQTLANLDLSSAGSLTIDNGVTLTITGTYTGGTGTINNQGTIVLQGASSQNFPGSSTVINNGTAEQMNNLTIDNSTGVNLNKSFTIAGTLTINSGKSLSVNAGLALTANSTFTNNGILNLLSDATGTATILTPATITGSGSYKIQQYLNSSLARNWYVSSPVTGATVPTGKTYYSYDETGSNTGFVDPASAYWVAVASGTTLSPLAVGYVAQTTAVTTAEFSGTALNNGTISTPTLSRTTNATKLGFNLVGNPYPSFVNARTAVNNTANLEKTIWYRTQNTSHEYTFDTYNTVSGIGTNNNLTRAVIGTVPPMQAFWVRVSTGSATLSFNNSLRSHKTDTINPFKVQALINSGQQVLRLQVSNGTSSDETIIMSNPNALNSYDNYDSPKFANDPTIPELYTAIGTERLAINGLNSLALNQEIPLGFATDLSTNFTIKATEISNFDSNIMVILKDGTTQNDITNSAYAFSSGVTSSTSRFSIILKTAGTATAINNAENAANILIYKNSNNQITVNYTGDITEKATVSVFNTIGQRLTTVVLTKATVTENAYKSGVYLVTVSNGAKVTTSKIVIK